MRILVPLLTVLGGCPYVGVGAYDENVRDRDGDGVVAVRFGGADCRDSDPTITDCDADLDGHLAAAVGGTDCDDGDASVNPDAQEVCNQRDDDCDGAVDNNDSSVISATPVYVDADGDGAGDPDRELACQELDGTTPLHATNDDDCNDADPAIRPGAEEVCDGLDNNCDTVVDDAGTWFVDADGDGFGRADQLGTGPCDLQPGSGLSAIPGDCNDADASISPGGEEVPYDGIDSNCNGGLDDWDVDQDGSVPAEHFAAANAANLLLPVDERWTLLSGDCDDNDPRRFDTATEVCDGVDNDCDGTVDADDLIGASPGAEPTLRSQVVTRFVDADGDGAFGTQVEICPLAADPAIHATVADDCFDSASTPGFGSATPAMVHPLADEICDGIDNDCDGRSDWDDTAFTGSSLHYLDSDGDGIGAAEVQACGAAGQVVVVGDDCNDGDPTVHPGAIELCGDGTRQDCLNASLFDCDADGFEGLYGGGGTGDDCNDVLAEVFPTDAPGAELCDGIDNDCDELIDSEDLDNLDAADEPFWYPDADGDGYGEATSPGVQQCDRPDDHVLVATDCDDGDAAVNPATVWFTDADGDGFGAAATAVASCGSPFPGAVRVAGDCDDGDPTLSPLTRWLRDDDGDFLGGSAPVGTFCEPPAGEPWYRESLGVDCDDDDPLVTAGQVWYLDEDFDGFGQTDQSVESCVAPTVPNARYVDVAGDCDDAAANINPAATESCNAADDDCDGHVDDDDDSLVAGFGGPIGYIDADGDGYGTTVAKAFCVAVPADGWAPATGDCQDDDPAINPNANEVCGNGIDDDCDGEEQIPVWYADADGDGYGTGVPSAPHCDPPAATGFASRTGDCDDDEPTTFPGAGELDACDAIDSDCDGTPEPRLTWSFDRDGDGYGDDTTAQISCSAPIDPPTPGEVGAWVLTGGDCDDTEESTTFGQIWYLDEDGDGLGNDASTQFACPQVDEHGNPATLFLETDVDGDGVYDPLDGDRQLTAFAGDCNDGQPGIGAARNFFPDGDDDGWGDANTAPVFGCPDALGNPPAGFVTRAGDCDDAEPNVNPDQDEIDGDTVDTNCDGFLDNEQGILWYPDADGDGLGDRDATATTSYSPGFRTNNVDCNDTDPAIGSGLWVYPDVDGDGVGAGVPFFSASCTVQAGTSLSDQDCDDDSDQVYPTAPELCDYVDNDCNGSIDEGAAELTGGFIDGDGDGEGALPALYCTNDPAGFAAIDGDCDDTDALVNTLATEVCDGIDNDCNGTVDPTSVWYLDADGDLFGGTITVEFCEAPSSQWVATPGDCDDNEPLAFPSVDPDVTCDGIDGNCSGLDPSELDLDGDGALACDDCDDDDPRRAPGNPEICDGVDDNDCDGLTPSPDFVDADADGFDACSDPDDADPNNPVDDELFTWFADTDGDGFGDAGTAVQSTAQPPGHVLDDTDCDDSDVTIHPGALELCDGIDNDCVGGNEPPAPSWYADLDGDGYGVAPAVVQCVAPSTQHVQLDGDCDDTEQLRNPGMNELCDGGILDNDCDGGTPGPESVDADGDGFSSCDDPDDTDPDNPFVPDWYEDVDGDGYGAGPAVSALTAPAGYVANDQDCDDTEPTVRPGVAERCNGIDDNCDGAVVDGSFDVGNPVTGTGLQGTPAQVYVADIDLDGTYSAGSLVGRCTVGSTDTTLFLGATTIPIRDVTEPGLAGAVDCEPGATAGAIYMRDADGDGVPGYLDGSELATGLLLDCEGGSPPAGFAFYDGSEDCAPLDPAAYELSGSTDWVDEDGDGYRVPAPLFTCVGDVFADPGGGVDCSDAMVDVTAGVADQVVVVADDADLDGLVSRCTAATLYLTGTELSLDLSLAQAGAALNLQGTNAAACEVAPGTCISLADTAPPSNLELGLLGIGLAADQPASWMFDGGQAVNVLASTLRDVSFTVAGSQLYLEDSTLFTSDDNPGIAGDQTTHLTLIGGTFEGIDTRFQGNGLGAVVIVSAGTVELRGSELNGKEFGVLASGGLVSIEDTTYDEILDRLVEATGAAILSLDGVQGGTDVFPAVVVEAANTTDVQVYDSDLAGTSLGLLADEATLLFQDSDLLSGSSAFSLGDTTGVEVQGGSVRAGLSLANGPITTSATFKDTALEALGGSFAIQVGALVVERTVMRVPNAVAINANGAAATIQLRDIQAEVGGFLRMNAVTTAPGDVERIDITNLNPAAFAVEARGGGFPNFVVSDMKIEGSAAAGLFITNQADILGERLHVDVDGTALWFSGANFTSTLDDSFLSGNRVIHDTDSNGMGFTATEVTFLQREDAVDPMFEVNSGNLNFVRSTLWSEAPVRMFTSNGAVNMSSSTVFASGGLPMFEKTGNPNFSVTDSVLDWTGGSDLVSCGAVSGNVSLSNVWVRDPSQVSTSECPVASLGPHDNAGTLGEPFYSVELVQLWPPIAAAYGRERP